MSGAKTGTPALEKLSARICSVTVLPVPVAPVIRPWRLASLRVRYSGFVLLPTNSFPSVLILDLPVRLAHLAQLGPLWLAYPPGLG
jgi:hypothetical protein